MSSFDESQIRRQPEGVSTGGQFAAQPKAEPQVALTDPAYEAAARAVQQLDTAQKVRLIAYLAAALEAESDTTAGEDLHVGQIIVDGGCYIPIDDVERSYAMPGMLAIETAAGGLYLDPDLTFSTVG
ncbi:hypothetical protein [Pseudactinotalea terrae]|uniref:hypothetical protein n=1 Tax=Pseudactinotalea terrae TaxID=1743262 RepID=UPI0012E2B7A6|nr:hypothetical protein [Pseudactinotalea terrae]